MEVKKCAICGDIFFFDDGSSNDHRSFDEWTCSDCEQEFNEQFPAD